MLHPRPICGGTRRNTMGETSIAIVGVEVIVILFLIPHRIGEHIVEAFQPRIAINKGRVAEGVADVQFSTDKIVQKGVHLRHSESGGGQLLPIDLWGCALFVRVRHLK